MLQQVRVDEGRKNIVCVDSYDDGILKGRFYNPHRDAENFASMSQFLLKMEEVMDEMQMPQSYTSPRRFSMLLQPEDRTSSASIRKGAKATFELKVIFRQNSSWQGIVVWREQKTAHSFHSVLELVILMDSALRSLERCGDT